MSHLKNLCYTVPLIGRIAIGATGTTPNGKRVPQRLNHFLITALYKSEDGEGWVEHPAHAAVCGATEQKQLEVREIPIKLMFNDPDLSVSSRYEAYNKETGRLLCAGDGEKARRVDGGGAVSEIHCPGADYCEYGKKNRCKPFSRALVQIDTPGIENESFYDELSGFMLRSSGFNTARTLYSKLKMLSALLGGKLRGVPLTLKLRKKSSMQSYNQGFYYTDLVLRGVSVSEAVTMAREAAEADKICGLDVEKFEAWVKEGLENGGFSLDTSEDFAEIEEFLLGAPDDSSTPEGADASDDAEGKRNEAVVGNDPPAPLRPGRASGSVPKAAREAFNRMEEAVTA